METNDLLACLLQVVARTAIPTREVRRIVGARSKQLKAFNLCDGSNTLAEIGKKTRIDGGNLSRAVARWREHGIVFLVGTGNEARYLHIYPLSQKEVPGFEDE